MRAVALALALILPSFAQAQKIPLEISALVDDVAKVLAAEKQAEVAIGSFVGRGDVPSTYGPEMARLLAAEFAKRKITVRKGSLYEINGDYRNADENPSAPGLKDLFLRINSSLENTKTGEKLKNEISSRAAYATNDELLQVFAPSASLPPEESREKRNTRIKEALAKPESYVASALVRAGKDSPFAVEMLVVKDANDADPAKGRAVEIGKDGLPLVEIKRHEIYRVKIYNDADFDVAVRLSIDGLDQFAFSNADFRKDGKPVYQHMVIAKKSSAVIKGWFRDLKTADSFLVAEYAKSAAAELKASGAELGQISVQFAAAWETEEQLRAEKSTGKDATARGAPVDVDLKPVVRHIGVTRANVGLRYTK